MYQILGKTDIQFTRKFPVTSLISGLLVALSLWGVLFHMNYGVDFRGGAEIQFKTRGPMDMETIRQALDSAGLGGIGVQSLGDASENEYIVRPPGTEETLGEVTEKTRLALEKALGAGNLEIRKVDIVGPKAGAALRVSGFQAMLWALLAVMVYIGLRFDFKYSPGAIAALFHDVSLILGIFALTGLEFTLQTVAALLAVIGYSVNDTVIVYDRVREHEQRAPEKPLETHINRAVNETLSRTILTSGTTLFVATAMVLWGARPSGISSWPSVWVSSWEPIPPSLWPHPSPSFLIA